MSEAAAERGTEARIAEAIAIANVPTLLMLLVQLTGDKRWIREPYKVHRQRGLGDNDSGGMPPERQAEVREAALEAILRWRAGWPVALPEPSDELLVEMLAWAMDDRVGPEYGPMVAALIGVRAVDPEELRAPEGFRALIIGAGASGLCAAIQFRRAGIPFTIVEKAETVGGVWWENQYPGAGVDTPNHLYSYSFFPYDWTQYFVLQDELHAYMSQVADSFDLRRHIQFRTEVRSCTWREDAQAWDVRVRDAAGRERIERASVVVSAVGIFNPARLPDIPGLETFAGPAFHTARWRKDVELDGKRVAIVGTGASSMQTAPEIADRVAELTIFQQSPQWAAPFDQFRKEVPEPLRFLFREVPLYRMWYRLRLGWTFNDRLHSALQKDPGWDHPERSLNAINDAHREYFTRYVVSELGERAEELLPKVLPTYPPYGKRMLMDNGWFRMLRKRHVRLVTEKIREVTPHGVVTADGVEYGADVLVLATGFDVLRFVNTYDVTGRGGRSLREAWADTDCRAYLGMAVPGFPNFFTLYGPNTQPGHGGSLIFVVEQQIHYLVDLFRQMAQRRIAVVECRRDVHDAYNARIDAAHEKMVWTHPGMETYYRNDRGRVTVNYPWRNVDLFAATRSANLADYVIAPSS
jgi:4-hydroxyacetophenone monooxygenase